MIFGNLGQVCLYCRMKPEKGHKELNRIMTLISEEILDMANEYSLSLTFCLTWDLEI